MPLVPLPTIPNVYRCTFRWIAHGAYHARNVVHVQAVGSTPAMVFAAFDAHVTANMWLMADGATAIEFVDILPLDGFSGTTSYPTSTPARWGGSGAAVDFVIAPAVLVKFSTGLRGPRNRGRVFLPFCTEATISDGAVVSGTLNSMQAAWTAFLAALAGAGPILGVASYKHAAFEPAATAVVESLLGTQKRRQDRLRRG